MGDLILSAGTGRTRVTLKASSLGNDIVVHITNESAHIGAVAVGEYDFANSRASVSTITRLGHKDDVIAYQAAYNISKTTHKPVCVIAGIHLDNITKEEIPTITHNAAECVKAYLG